MTVFSPRDPQCVGFRPRFHAPMKTYVIVMVALFRKRPVQLNGGLDYRFKLSNNASLTEGPYSQGIDA